MRRRRRSSRRRRSRSRRRRRRRRVTQERPRVPANRPASTSIGPGPPAHSRKTPCPMSVDIPPQNTQCEPTHQVQAIEPMGTGHLKWPYPCRDLNPDLHLMSFENQRQVQMGGVSCSASWRTVRGVIAVYSKSTTVMHTLGARSRGRAPARPGPAAARGACSTRRGRRRRRKKRMRRRSRGRRRRGEEGEEGEEEEEEEEGLSTRPHTRPPNRPIHRPPAQPNARPTVYTTPRPPECLPDRPTVSTDRPFHGPADRPTTTGRPTHRARTTD